MPPAYTERQRKFLAAALGRKEAGRSLKSDPKMTTTQLKDFVRTKPKPKAKR